MPVDDAALQELLDKQACQDVLARYSCALEWLDEEALGTVFFPDAEVDYGYFRGRGDEFVSTILGIVRGYLRTWHNNGPALIQIAGDVAQAESHGTGATVVEQGDQVVTNVLGGRYFDRLERRDGRWAIARRSYFVDWHRTFNRDAAEEELPMMNVLTGAGPEHSLYRLL